MNTEPLHIAVVGSGAAGLVAAHLLQRRHCVTLIERERRLGGHVNTVVVSEGPDAGTPIDTGFIVMNHRNYPLLTRLFEQLGVELRDSDMSFGYHDLTSGLQYCGSGLDGLFAQRGNLVKPSFLRMLRDTLRFFRFAKKDLADGNLADETLGEYLAHRGFGREFIEHHLAPMASAIWSAPAGQMMEFPAQSILRFFDNHGLLSLGNRPQWKTVVGGSRSYVERMRQEWKQVDIRLGTDIATIKRDAEGVEIAFDHGGFERFDHVVVATHADQALRLLGDATNQEKDLLGCWRYARNRATLHSDESAMPPLRKVWSSWNFRRIDGTDTCMTYYMNRLQGLRTQRQYFVSLNLPKTPANRILDTIYEHPMFTREALRKRPILQQLNGRMNTWYAGSYFGNGFHEDAVRSAVNVATAFGIEL